MKRYCKSKDITLKFYSKQDNDAPITGLYKISDLAHL